MDNSDLVIYSYLSFEAPTSADVTVYLSFNNTGGTTEFEQPLAHFYVLRSATNAVNTVPLIGGVGEYYNLEGDLVTTHGVKPVYVSHPFGLRLRLTMVPDISPTEVEFWVRTTVIRNAASQPVTDIFQY